MEYLPISKINTVVFCPRRYYIEMLLADTLTNHHVTDGQTLHDRAKRTGEGLWVWSDTLGLNGIIDQIKEEEGELILTEFKKGYLGDHESDQVQLCAQAICYEETFDASLKQGFIYYHTTRRRQEVRFTTELRQAVVNAVNTMRAIDNTGTYPPITPNPNKCRGCSVKEACQPSLTREKKPTWKPN